MGNCNNFIHAGLWRRFAALMYDFMILFAVLIIATAIILPFVGNTAIKPHNLYYQLYLGVVCFGFYAWFWHHRGQTIGMLAWNIKLHSLTHEQVTWRQIIIRICCAFPSYLCFGLGFFSAWCNRERATWHDYLSHTRVIRTDEIT